MSEQRTIRFRVWDGQAMIYPGTADDMERRRAAYLLDTDGALILVGDDGLYNAPDAVPLQFTGLTDAEGREVYEGDILQIVSDDEDSRFVVGWDRGAFTADYGPDDDGFPVNPALDRTLNGYGVAWRVIGNTFLNMDLL